MGGRCGFDVSASGVRAVLHRPVRLGAEPDAQCVLAALEQERKLAHRQRQRALPRPLPRNRPTKGIVTVLAAAGMLAGRRAARRLPTPAMLGAQLAAAIAATWSDDAASRGIFFAQASGSSSSMRDMGQPA